MNLKLTEEEKLIKDMAARFAKSELLPLEGSFLKQKAPFLPPGDPPTRVLDAALGKGLGEKARMSGIWFLNLPEGFGGAGLSQVARVLVYRELGYSVIPFEPPDIPLRIPAALGRKVASGELSFGLAFGEIHRTGDVREVSATYRKTAQGYRLNGSRIGVLESVPDLFLLPAREEGSGRIGLFLVETSSGAVVVEKQAELNADRTVVCFTLNSLDVADGAQMGGEAELRDIVTREQLKLAARSLGIGNRCLNDSLEHARNRVTFGAPLSSRQAIQWLVADVSVSLRASTWLAIESAWRADEGLPYYFQAALAKRMATRAAFEAADVAIQVHGGYGVCKEFPFETFYRETRLMRLLYGREAVIDQTVGEEFFRVEQ